MNLSGFSLRHLRINPTGDRKGRPYRRVPTTTQRVPPIIFALLAQRYIIRGLTLGAVKG
jgi:hypothetical protein